MRSTESAVLVEDDGTDTVLHVEKNPFDGSSVDDQGGAIDGTLAGVTAKTSCLTHTVI